MQCAEGGSDGGTSLCIQELHADLLDDEVKSVLRCGYRLVSINAHSVAQWTLEHQLTELQRSDRPICLGFIPMR